MATINDIAKLAGVSKSTVSRVVSKHGFVKEETREKIEKAMKTLDYHPNLFASGMRTNKSHSIGIVFPELSNTYFSEWYEVVDRIARERGYMNYICITDPEGVSEERRLDDLVGRSIDGIIFFTYCKHPEVVRKLKAISQHTPLICSDAMMEDTGLSCVYGDGRQGTYEAAKSLIKSGRKRIGYIGGKAPFTVVERRAEGYFQAMEEAGLRVDADLLYASNFKKACGYKAAESFMSLPEPPDAIMSSTDAMAIGALEYLQEHNIKVPEQVAIFGCNDQEMMANVSPALSTIAYPIKDLAETAIHALVDQIENRKPLQVNKVFDCRLVLREST